MFEKKNQNKDGLKIIIVGCGKVGKTLIEELSQEGHELTIIDKRSSRIEEVTNQYDIMGICGNGASYSIQKEAGIEKADLVIAVTDSDELNLLCCTIAKRVGNCAAIARVRTPDYSKEVGYLRDKLGLALIINPELEAAKEAARILFLPTALEVNSFAHGQAEMVKLKVPEGNPLDGNTVAYLGKHITNEILICAIEREGEVYIPSGDFIIKAGDIISFTSTRKVAREFMHKIDLDTKRVKNCLIVGGGRASYYLSKELMKGGVEVTIIEQDFKRCEELSIMLPKAIVINGDGTDKEFLKEAGIVDAQAFVALTGIDEENILLTLYAKQVSQAKVITKINRINFTEVIGNLDLGSVIYPKYITAEAIIAYVRAKKASKDSNVETLAHMFNHRVEAIEFKVQNESSVTGVPFKDMKLKKNLLVAFIARKGNVLIPSGNDTLEVGDTVMIVTTHTGFKELTDILA